MRLLHYITGLLLTGCCFAGTGQTHHAIVADSATHTPLPGASVFDRNGNLVGITSSSGCTPYLAEERLPLTVRYIGYSEKGVDNLDSDTLFIRENPKLLAEVVVETGERKVMHVLAYVREYSTLTNFSDTVFLFREKMVDNMLNPDPKIKFKEWRNPRVLKSKSYYRFTNAEGLDSVSDETNYHFSWSDWIGMPGNVELPVSLKSGAVATDTVRGKYSPTEIWSRRDDRVTLSVNVLADRASRKWVPNLDAFFRNELDFESFRLKYNYENVRGGSISPMDMTGYSCHIESNGRGHGMFMFNKVGEPVFVSTYAETYILDKEYITLPEARKWERMKFDSNDIVIFEPADAPPLQAEIQRLVDRVNNVDKEAVKLAQKQDMSLVRKNVVRPHFGKRVLQLLKDATGISAVKTRRNEKKFWRKFRKEQMTKNNSRFTAEDDETTE